VKAPPHAAKLAAVGAIALATLTMSAGSALAAPGGLDPTFDGDGKLVLPFPAEPSEVLVQPDGKIVVAGTDTFEDFSVWRFHADGSPDRSFGGDGTAVANFGGNDRLIGGPGRDRTRR
jgi:uncharacterized delta-60 repeat protein